MLNQKRLIFLFANLGFILSAYLLWTYLTGDPIACSDGGCETVRASTYSYIFGIPQPLLGVLYYLTIMIGLLFSGKLAKLLNYNNYLLFLGLTSIGFIYSLYLTYLEAFVIKAFCIWCVFSGVLSSFLFILAVRLNYGKTFRF